MLGLKLNHVSQRVQWVSYCVSFKNMKPDVWNRRQRSPYMPANSLQFSGHIAPVDNELLQYLTSNGSWRQGIKGEMTCTVYVAFVWNIIYLIMMIITLFTE